MSTPPPALGFWRRRLEALGISFAGGALLWAATSQWHLGPLVALAYTVLLAPAVCERWRAPLVGFVPGFLVAVVIMHEPLSKWGTLVQIALPIVLTYHFTLVAILAATLRRFTNWPAFVIVPFSIGFAEWTRPLLGVGSFNFYAVGAFLAPYPVLTQAAELIGSLGLSVLWSFPFAVALDAVRRVVDGRGAIEARSLRRGALASAAIVVVLAGFGALRLATIDVEMGPRIAVVQPSEERTPERTALGLQAQQQLTANLVPRGAADLVAWPENAILDVWQMRPPYREVTRWVAMSRDAPLVFGTMDIAPDGVRPTNTTYLIDTDGTVLGRYDKIVLFPFTERRFFPGLESISPALRETIDGFVARAWGRAPDGWSPDRVTTLELPAREEGGEALRFWTPICYESAQARLGREAGRLGARFFVNLTSEGWLGWPASNNQMAVNILRAVENRVGSVRVGNTGPSAFILPNGHVDEYLRGMRTGRLRVEPGVLIHRVALGDGEPTLYARFGDVLDPAWAMAWVGLLIAGIVRKRGTRGEAASP